MWLVKYEGGGYDGCLWEANFLLCDDPENPQTMVCIKATGIRGIRGLTALQKRVAEKPGEWYLGLYDLQADGWNVFRSEVTADQVVTIGGWLTTYEPSIVASLTIQCYECGQEIAITEILLEDWRGIGGVASECAQGICQSCKDLRDHQALVKDIARLIEIQWDEWVAYHEWASLENDPSFPQDQIIEYAIRRWADEPNPREIADWIMSNWDEAKKGMCQDQQEDLAL
jgi:hypothetical protein